MVPNGWKVARLEDIASRAKYSMVDGPFGSNLKSEHYREVGVPVLQSGFVTSGWFKAKNYVYVEQQLFEEQKRSSAKAGDILMAKIGAQAGRCGIIPDGHPVSIIAGNCLKLTFDDEITSTKYMHTALSWEYERTGLVEIKTETAQPAISLKSLKSFRMVLPPLPEQRKIALILSTWDKAITTTEKLIETSKQQKKALMQQLLTGKKRLVNPETGKVFEGEWEEVPLSNWLVEFKEKSSVQDQHRVYTSSRSGLVPQDEYFGNSRISDRKNIGFHILPPEHMTYRSRSDDGYFTFNLFKGNENGIISHYYPVFTSKGSNDFFIALLEQYRNVFGKHSVGTSQKVLSFNALKAIRFFVPSTDEQQKIASVLTAADKEIELLNAKLAHLKQEKKALMQQLLTGKRRVMVADTEAA